MKKKLEKLLKKIKEKKFFKKFINGKKITF